MTSFSFLRCLQRNPARRVSLFECMELAEAAANLTEAERRQLFKEVQAKQERTLTNWHLADTEFMALAVLAVGPLSAVKKIQISPDFETAALKILCDRKPDWLEKWLAHEFARDFSLVTWWLVEELLRAGLCSKPASEDYLRFFARSFGVRYSRTQDRVIRRELLQKSPEHIADVWRCFEIETSLFQVITEHPYEADWAATLLGLSADGLMDRQRLLRETLRTLGSDFSNQSLTGLVRFYARLAPTDDERKPLQPSLFQLLASRVSHVVTFALEQLADLQKAGALDGPAFLAAAPQVFLLKPKGQPKTVLTMAAKIAKDQPELATECANLAIEALTHEASEVQAAAVKLLEGWKSRLHRDHASELQHRCSGLAASVRSRVQALIESLDPESEKGPARSKGEAHSNLESVIDPERWRTRAAAFPKWRSLAGVDDALDAAAADSLYLGSWFNVNYVPVLTSCAPIVPIATVDELFDAVAHAVERIESANEIERILDGISRLCDQRPPDFEHRAQPLVQRLLKERPDQERGLLAYRMTPKLPLLLFRWLGYDLANKPPEPVSRWLGQPLQRVEDPRALTKFIERRLREIEARVAKQKPAPLLSAPTHQHGWLDPRVFVERLRHYSTSSPPLVDLIQALLRLAPDHRPEALTAAADLPGESAVVRFALGGPPPTEPIVSEEAFSLWLAAARSRQAHWPLDSLVPVAGEQRRHLVLEPSFVWETADANPVNRYLPSGTVSVRLDVEPTLPRAESLVLQPTLAIREDNLNRWGDFGPEWAQAWMENLWPANLDHFLVDGIRHLRQRVNAAASSLEPNQLYLQPLLAPDRPWNELTWLALWIALVSKDAGARGLALDVLIAGIEDGRAEMKLDVLLKLAAAPWFKLNRLADAAREVARVSPRHAWWCAELLQRFAAHVPEWSSDIHHVLALLLELLTELQLSVHEPHRDQLATKKATGKSAKLQKSLLALTTTANSPQRQRAHELALTATLARAERWNSGNF